MIPETTWWIAILAVVAVLVIGKWRQMRAKPLPRKKSDQQKKDRDGGGGYVDTGTSAPSADGSTKKSPHDNDGWDGGEYSGGGDGGGGGGD
jgi:uncharacterized membrane protein